jgi:hypothetical protein
MVELKGLLPIVISIAVLGIAIVYVLSINADLRGEMACPPDYTFNSSEVGGKCIWPYSACDPVVFPYWNETISKCCKAASNCTGAANISDKSHYTNLSAFTLEGNSSLNVESGLGKIPAKLPLVLGVLVAVVIIGLLVTGLGGITTGRA